MVVKFGIDGNRGFLSTILLAELSNEVLFPPFSMLNELGVAMKLLEESKLMIVKQSGRKLFLGKVR